MAATLNPPRNSDKTTSPKSETIDQITRDLDAIVSRLRRQIWIAGSLAIGAASLVCLLALIVIDAIFQPESTWLRLALWLPLIGVVGAVAVRLLVMPLRSECDRLAMAWTLEQQRPAIEERLTTSLQLTKASNGRSSALIDAVAQQAQESLAGCHEEDLRGQQVLRRTIVAVACLATFVLSMWIWSPYLVPSLQNMLCPWNTRVLPRLNATIGPGNTIVGEGSDLQITATANHLTDAVLEIVDGDAVITSHPMSPNGNGWTVAFTLTELKADLQYRVRSGGLFSDRYQIVVEPKPVIEQAEVGLRFPEYTELPPEVVNDLSEPIETIHGTRLRVDVDSTLPCSDSSLTLNGTTITCGEAVLIKDTGLWRHSWEFMATTEEVQTGTVKLLSEAGVVSEPLEFEVRALPDLPPSIVVDQPALSDVMAPADGSIDVVFHAFDDFGCGALQLISQKNDEPPSSRNVPHDWETEGVGELTVDLSELEAATGDQLTLWLSISDSRPVEYGGPQVTDSRKVRIQIADDATSVGQQVVQQQTQSVLDHLTAAITDLKAAEEIADNLAADVNEVGEVGGVGDSDDLWNAPVDATDKTKELQKLIGDAERALKQLTGPDENASQDLFQQEIEQIQDVTENEVAEAKKQAGLVPLSDDRPQQQEAIAATNESLNDAIDKLEEAREDVDQRSKQLELAAQLDELARQQEEIAQDLDEAQGNAPDAQEKQQQVADALQDVVEQDLDAKSEQFAQRAKKAAELTEKAAELQAQQESLAKLDQIRSKEELDEQLLGLIAKEQEQIANETRELEEKTRDSLPPTTESSEPAQQNQNAATEADQNRKSNSLAEARKQMEAVPEKLRENDLEQAEVEARKAEKQLQNEAKPSSQNAAPQPNSDDKNAAARKQEDLARLAQQQKRVGDAIKAVREDRSEEAVAKLQEQIAEKTGRLRDEADELLRLPTEDPENQQAVQDAREKLEQAQKDTRAAEKLASARQEQTDGQQQAGEQQQAGDSKKASEEQQQAGDPEQTVEQQQQAGDSNQASETQQQAGDPKQTGEQQQQAGDPKPTGEQQQQSGDPEQAREQQQKASDPDPAGEQQKQAAKSLQEATQSLESVCKSCQKCSKCNKPSASSGSGGGAPKKRSEQSEPKQEGNQSNKSQPGPKSGEPGQSAPNGQKPEAQKLAATADKAHETARTPSPNGTQELAQDLNQLADEAAQQAGYPNRNSKSPDRQSKQQKSSQQNGTTRPGRPTKPEGVRGNAEAGQSQVAPTQLRGRSSSNWTQSRRKLKSNVLDDEESKIPEEFRGVVKGYFEELSRLESRQEAAEDQE